jgi:hypothetical protein
MLEWIDEARVNIEIVLTLDYSDCVIFGLEKESERAGCDAFAEGGENATRNEDIFCLKRHGLC